MVLDEFGYEFSFELSLRHFYSCQVLSGSVRLKEGKSLFDGQFWGMIIEVMKAGAMLPLR